MKKDLIRIQGVSKKFDSDYVLKDINLTIKEGEALGIIGLSGSGKSVLIHIIRGYREYKPTEGKVIYNIALCKNCYWVDVPSKAGENCLRCDGKLEECEVDIWELEDKELAAAIRKRVGIMLQRTFALYSEQSALENVMEAISSAGLDGFSFGATRRVEMLSRTAYTNDVINKAVEYLKAVNLSHRMMTPARDLSGGEKQRVILARQLAIEPIVLLADEPTGTLDPENTRVILNALKKYIKDHGRTLILTSHIPQIIEKLSDRVVWLDRGRIVAEGDPKSIIKKFLEQVSKEEIKTEIAVEQEILKLRDVKKYYYSVSRGVVKAVDGVTLVVKEGEIFGILGPSGSGKTTLSRIIAGIIPPTNGEVYIRIGDDWVDMRAPGLTGKGRATPYIGILHQEYGLFPFRSVLENLTDSISLDFPAEFARMRAIDVLMGVGFSREEAEKILERSPDELSEGQRHRVALAQVMIREPRLLLLDEPSGTMDPITKIEVAKTLNKIREETKATIVVISHDMEFTRLVCDRVALMLDGKIRLMGSANEVIESLEKLELKISEIGEIVVRKEEEGMISKTDTSCGV
ncbi:MAG: methyl coenzyme M reductase system, component A2 [Archaeoglobales archaeon]|nr:methyl coenzyme M reductase system, component A2 [Archaeoglobales archaeon]